VAVFFGKSRKALRLEKTLTLALSRVLEREQPLGEAKGYVPSPRGVLANGERARVRGDAKRRNATDENGVARQGSSGGV
jgi:hypothetical protein